MRYVEAKFAERQEADAYRIYVSDTLKIMNHNMANMFGGIDINVRYYDFLHPAPVEKRTPEQIVEEIRSKLG